MDAPLINALIRADIERSTKHYVRCMHATMCIALGAVLIAAAALRAVGW